jgi:cytochrome c5
METLVTHAINGYNAMPAKGGCSSCSDEEIQVAVELMVEDSQ